MRSKAHKYQNEAVRLRAAGYTFREIKNVLRVYIPQSALSHWCRGVPLSEKSRKRILQIRADGLCAARRKSLEVRSEKRVAYWTSLFRANEHYIAMIADKQVAKLVLAALFIGEGSKRASSSLVFGNSNVHVIQLFLELLRSCYFVEESKLRCAVQCRADQDQERLVQFWSEVTGIPKGQFYQSRVDLRTIGKPSNRTGYRGVCRIDYFSAEVYNELRVISSVLFGLDHLGL